MSGKTRLKMPSRKQIVDAWYKKSNGKYDFDPKPFESTCWACGIDDIKPVRAHIVPHNIDPGKTSDPLNYFLLCKQCHADQPDMANRSVQLEWLSNHYSHEERLLLQAKEVLSYVKNKMKPTDAEMTAYSKHLEANKHRIKPDCAAANYRTVTSNIKWCLISDMCLFFKEICILPIHLHQLLVGPVFLYSALIKNKNTIGHFYRGKPVADEHS